MPKQREKDLDLPARVYKKHGAYYYVHHDKRWERLGTSRIEALAQYHRMADSPQRIMKISDLIDRYMKEISPLKAETTHESEIAAARNLNEALGHIPPTQLTTRMVYEYMDMRGKTAPTRTNREIALLSHMFKKGIRWGASDFNPVVGVERNKEKPRTRYVTDNELRAFQSVCPEWMALYCELKYYTGLRKTDMLDLQWSKIDEVGIHVKVSKTSGNFVFLNTPKTLETLEKIKEYYRDICSPYVFPTQKGTKYTDAGFRAIFYRAMQKTLEKNLISESFREPDIRAKTGSDSESSAAAKTLLGHSTKKTTNRHYRRLPEKVTPLV